MPNTTTSIASLKKIVAKKIPKKIGTKAEAKVTAGATTVKKNKVRKEAPPEQCFWVNNGPICKTHTDLKKALKTMSKAQYAYHIKNKNGSNDFANWLDHVMGHHGCAVKLKKARTQASAVKALEGCAD